VGRCGREAVVVAPVARDVERARGAVRPGAEARGRVPERIAERCRLVVSAAFAAGDGGGGERKVLGRGDLQPGQELRLRETSAPFVDREPDRTVGVRKEGILHRRRKERAGEAAALETVLARVHRGRDVEREQECEPALRCRGAGGEEGENPYQCPVLPMLAHGSSGALA